MHLPARCVAALCICVAPFGLIPVAGCQSDSPGDADEPPDDFDDPDHPPGEEPGDEELVRSSLRDDLTDEVFYFVLPDRFANGDESNDTGGIYGQVLDHGFDPTDKGFYHGGDLAGLFDKIDYLEELGVTAIWMAPIFTNRPVQGGGDQASAGYHGYWVTDFTRVDPHFGTNEELRQLIDAAHARGIKVFFDIIVNHTADVIDYAEATYAYRNKTDDPYRDASGNAFDDVEYAGSSEFPELDPAVSFPYTPTFRCASDAEVKVPAWLNDVTMYHNRGDSTFAGESSQYGDFFGLDDLFTERAEVVQGMIDIHAFWISEFGIDGFRMDTAKHVNTEFWQAFAPAIRAHARAEGKVDFFLFGEVFDGDPVFLSTYTTAARLPAVLDFGFQGRARGFASGSAATHELRDLFALDDYYTDHDSNVYSLPTFLGNHDMGRIGYFLHVDNAGADDRELLDRSRLAHALMYFARGMPVVYSGDEQGFTGDGGDKDAREDSFASQVASYNDNDLIGTDATTADDNYDTTHPLYMALADYAAVTAAHPALRSGAQIHRHSGDSAGIYAFSRIDRDEQIEYIVALNNAESMQTAAIPTYLAGAEFSRVFPPGEETLTTDGEASLTVAVPPLSAVVYQARSPLPAADAAPGIVLTNPVEDAEVTGRVEVAAALDGGSFAEVTFAVQTDDDAWTVIGTDDNPPYRVFYDVAELTPGTRLRFKAIVQDASGNLGSASSSAVVGEPRPPSTCSIGEAVVHYRREAGDYQGWGLHLWGDGIDPAEVTDWNAPKPLVEEDEYGRLARVKLASVPGPVNFIVHTPGGDQVPDTREPGDDRSFDPCISSEVWLLQGDETIYTSRPPVGE